jgi:hypothetical protein
MVTTTKLRALRVRQPFAELIMTGEKGIEHRSRSVNLRGGRVMPVVKLSSVELALVAHALDELAARA